MRTSAVVAAALGLVMTCGAPVGAGPAEDLTFEGVAAGGTIAITTTPDRAGILRVELEAVQFSSAAGCDALATLVRYYDPPEPVTNDSFNATLWFVGATSGATDYVSVQGALLSSSELQGTARYTAAFAPEQGCLSDIVSWAATGPVDTPPGSGDLLFEGTFQDVAGAISFTTDPERLGITSITIDGASLPCTPDAELVDVRAFFAPPLLFDPETGVAQATISFTPADALDSHTLTVSAELTSEVELSGSIESLQPIPSCTGETAFIARLVASPTATSTPTRSATPAERTPGQRQTPPRTGTVGPVALPSAGAARGGAPPWWVLPGAVGLALVGAAAIVRRAGQS